MPGGGSTGLSAKAAAVFPEVFWFKDAGRGDDAGNEIGRSDVEAGINSAAGGVGDADVFAFAFVGDAPGAEHFAFVAVFDWDFEAVLEVPIDRGKRNGD